MALSIASLIAMAGDTVTMAEGAMLMIHGPHTIAAGNAGELRETAATLDRFAEAMVPPYAAKSGKSRSAILRMLTDGRDHWLSADEAVAAGFADRVSTALPVAAQYLDNRFMEARHDMTTETESRADRSSGS